MRIENKHPDYYIRGFTYKKETGSIHLHWRYKEADGFLIFFYDSRKEFDLCAACEEINSAGILDAEIVEQSKKPLPVGADAFWKLAHINKSEYIRNGRSFRLSAQELKKDIPYGICAFACTYDEKRGELHIYEADARENTCFLPVKIKAEMRYKTKFFSKEKYCILRLPKIADYKDGAILYHVDGAASDFPLPQSCMGRELVIAVPKHAQVSIRVREEDKKYYSMSDRV